MSAAIIEALRRSLASYLVERGGLVSLCALIGYVALPFDPGVPLGEVLLHTGRPVFVDPGLTALRAAFPSYPFGVVYRLLPATAAPPPASGRSERCDPWAHDRDRA